MRMFLFDLTLWGDQPYRQGQNLDLEISLHATNSSLTTFKTKRWIISPGDVTHAALDVSMVGSTKAFLNLPFVSRKCVAPGEVRLSFFETYE